MISPSRTKTGKMNVLMCVNGVVTEDENSRMSISVRREKKNNSIASRGTRLDVCSFNYHFIRFSFVLVRRRQNTDIYFDAATPHTPQLPKHLFISLSNIFVGNLEWVETISSDFNHI